ncbi:MAG: TonB-dependent receptor plug domain-containing protein [Bacteroidota bacterium]
MFFAFANAQASNDPDTCNLSIKGRILDADSKLPVPFSVIKVENSSVNGVADSEGFFTLNGLCNLELNLVISSLGYKPLRHHHDAHHTGGITVYLTDSTTFLESILVEGKLISQEMESMSFEQVQAEDLRFAASGSLGDVLANLQGVSFSSNGANVKIPIIHGLQGNRILIINNGLKHGFQNWGSDHAPEIDLNSANNITVLKGAAGVRYGPEALGGVILIEADPLKLANPFYGQVGAQYQSNGRGYHSYFKLGEGFDRFSYHVGGSYTRIGDRKSPDYFLTNTGKQELGLNVGLRYHLPNWDFEIFYSYLDQDLTILRASVTEDFGTFGRLIDAPEPVIIRDFSYDLNEPKQLIQHQL